MDADLKTRTRVLYLIQRAFPTALAQHIARKQAQHKGAFDAIGDLHRQVGDGFYRESWLKRLRAKWFFVLVRNAISEASTYALSRQNDLEEEAKLKPFGIGLYQSEVVYWCRDGDFDSPTAVRALLDADDAVRWQAELDQIYGPLVQAVLEALKREVKAPQIVA